MIGVSSPASRPADTSTPFSLRFQNEILDLFDRSGTYKSRSFGIHDEPDKRARALVGYATMADNMMSLDTFVERKDGQLPSLQRCERGCSSRRPTAFGAMKFTSTICQQTRTHRASASPCPSTPPTTRLREGCGGLRVRRPSCYCTKRSTINWQHYPSLYIPGEKVWENRIYYCLVVSPASGVIASLELSENYWNLSGMRSSASVSLCEG